MATYRKATEKDISKGKGKSTDELSLAEATAYFNKRAGETGAKKFRYKGEVYDLSGNKSTVAATPKPSTKAADDKPMRPRARPAAPEKVAMPTGNGGGGADAGNMPATGVAKPKSYTSSGRGFGAGEMARRRTDAKKAAEAKDAARNAKEESSNTGKKVAAGAAAVGIGAAGVRAAMDKAATNRAAARAAASKPPAASATTPSPAERAAARLKLAAEKPATKTTVTVPKYNNIGVSRGRNWVPESAFTDKPTPSKESTTKPVTRGADARTAPKTGDKAAAARAAAKTAATSKKGGPRVGQSKAATPTATRGAGGGVSATPSKTVAPTVTRGAGSGVRLSPSPVMGLVLGRGGNRRLIKGNGVLEGPPMLFMNKGGMVKKGKK